MLGTISPAVTAAIAALSVAGVIVRPLGWAEWIFASLGAALLLLVGSISVDDVWIGVASGFDVYLFLAGMMLLAEVARREGLFDWLAVGAARSAKGSTERLFVLVYLIGTLVTVFLSNDATAVVLTPAVAAVARTARVAQPMPYLLICAFVANAASFVLPISNPANLVIFGSEMPPLGEWLARFALPSLLSVTATFLLLRWTQRNALAGSVSSAFEPVKLSGGGRVAAVGLVLGALVLLVASALGLELGPPTALVGIATFVGVVIVERSNPIAVVRGISWDTLLLVAALFVIVRALEVAGLSAILAEWLEQVVRWGPELSPAIVGGALALLTNVTNNLPLGLLAGDAVNAAAVSDKVIDAVLIGIDLGPNLSVTGSLATILWLTALRREGLHFGAVAFLRIGLVVMPPALLLALAAVLLQPW